MQKKANANFFSSETRILFWPSFVDMLITTLMIILLVYFLQTVLNVGDLESLKIRQQQEEFINSFNKKFASEVKQKKVDIKSDLNLIQITFNNEVLFVSGDYQLQPQGREILRHVAELFKNSNSHNFKQIQVEGYTDSDRITRPKEYPHNNWELSTGRAISVVKYLIEDNQLSDRFNMSDRFNDKATNDKVIISANGYAEFRPVANNNTDAGKAKNRRIEIRIHFSTPENNKK
jgi:chemotaxis protein MotB